MFTVRCGRDAFASRLMALVKEAALLGRDGNHMRNKMIVMGREVAVLFREIGLLLSQLYPTKYLEYKDKDKVVVASPRFIHVARNGNVYIATDTCIWRFILKVPLQPEILVQAARDGNKAWIGNRKLNAARIQQPGGLVELQGHGACSLLCAVDQGKFELSAPSGHGQSNDCKDQSDDPIKLAEPTVSTPAVGGCILIVHVHFKAATPSSKVHSAVSTVTVVKIIGLPKDHEFHPLDICLLGRDADDQQTCQGGWTVGLTSHTGHVYVGNITVTTSKQIKGLHETSTKKKRVDAWPVSYTLKVTRIINAARPHNCTSSRGVMYWTDLGSETRNQSGSAAAGGEKEKDGELEEIQRPTVKITKPGIWSLDSRKSNTRAAMLADLEDARGLAVRGEELIVGAGKDNTIRCINISTRQMKVIIQGGTESVDGALLGPAVFEVEFSLHMTDDAPSAIDEKVEDLTGAGRIIAAIAEVIAVAPSVAASRVMISSTGAVYTVKVSGFDSSGDANAAIAKLKTVKAADLLALSTAHGHGTVDLRAARVTTAPRPLGPARTYDTSAIAVEGNTVFLVSASTGILQVVSRCDEIAAYMDMGREWAELAGVLHPKLEKNEKERARVRNVKWMATADAMARINADKREWYQECRTKHGLAATYKGMTGAFGCSDQRVHQTWEMNEESIRIVDARLWSIRATEIRGQMRYWKQTTLPLETNFGHLTIETSTHERTHTVETIGAIKEGLRKEVFKSHLSVDALGFNHTLGENKLYQGAKVEYKGLTEADLKIGATKADTQPSRTQSYRHEKYLQAVEKKNLAPRSHHQAPPQAHVTPKTTDEEADAMTRLALLLRRQASQRLRDRVKKPAGFTLTTLCGLEMDIPEHVRESIQCTQCGRWRIVDDPDEWGEAGIRFTCDMVDFISEEGTACAKPCDECESSGPNGACLPSCVLQSVSQEN